MSDTPGSRRSSRRLKAGGGFGENLAHGTRVRRGAYLHEIHDLACDLAIELAQLLPR